MSSGGGIGAEAARRRTFAIISHPDAGKTTLTEKSLLYSHAETGKPFATVVLEPAGYTIARRTDPTSAERLRSIGGVAVYARPDGTLYALVESPYWLQRIEADHPHLTLEPILAS